VLQGQWYSVALPRLGASWTPDLCTDTKGAAPCTTSPPVQAPFTLAEIYHAGAPGPGTRLRWSCPQLLPRGAPLQRCSISERSTWARDLKGAALGVPGGGRSGGPCCADLLLAEEGSRLGAENAAARCGQGEGLQR